MKLIVYLPYYYTLIQCALDEGGLSQSEVVPSNIYLS